ncbi:MAG: beta-hydroxyacyl-ACP dehydratase [Phycisphaerales bacterium JB039]
MRWMWIDRIISLAPGEQMTAIKRISMAEDHLHDQPGGGVPIMPASLIIEGMAQTAGLLVGHANQFREKVVLAKISRAQLDAEARPGATLWYTARIVSMDDKGAATWGLVELEEPGAERMAIGQVDLIFSHLDQAGAAGLDLPEHNFVFSESFRTLLEMSGIR